MEPISNQPIQFVSQSDFETEILSSEIPVLVEFTAAWSAPCKMNAPEVEAIAFELHGRAKVVRVDVDKAQALVGQLRIQSLPAYMVVSGGKIAGAKQGPMKRAQLRQMIEPFLPRAEGAVSPAEASELAKEGRIVFVDTRDLAAYQRTHLPGAVHMPLDGLENRLAELHMLAGPAVLYCRAGDKTQAMAETLASQGVPVAFLEGGLLAWEAASLPVQRS